VVRLLQAFLAGLFFSALLVFAPLVHAGDQREKSAAARQDVDSDPHAGIGDFAALRQYVRETGIDLSSSAASGSRQHPRFDTTEFTALRDYARAVGIKALPAEAEGTGWVHPGLDGVQATAAPDAMEGGQLDLQSPSRTASTDPHVNSPEIVALRDYARGVGIEAAPAAAGAGRGWVHPRLDEAAIAAAGQTGPQPPSQTDPRSLSIDDPELAALHDHVRQMASDSEAGSDKAFQVAEADNAFDAFREMLRRNRQPTPAPGTAPEAHPRRPIPQIATQDPSFANARRLGSQTCLYCHAVQADAFGKTLMGRIGKTQPAKFDCENCHGPGSAHVQAVGCAACHGEGGITRRPGIPSLIGQDPRYLTQAMKAYVTGQRRHDMMRLVLSGLGEGEIRNIAAYYARQPADRAATPPVGDPSAGKAATALCAGCHGELGISVSPAWWPSLAGQDAQYLADAIQAYKAGARSKAIACAGCHGEGGVSAKAGIPSLAGMGQQYLVAAMKDYASGERKHGVMRALLTGVDDGQLKNFALFYAHQGAAKSQTPALGDASAGKGAAALCTGCHGEAGGSVSEAFPSLAGQDARYLSGAIKAYRDGARHKAVTCAACHGEKGISKKPGIPSLAGLASQYLVAEMKEYADGKRKHAVMNALLAGVAESELNNIADFYSRQVPARAATPTLGDAAAGKTSSAPCAGCHGPQGVAVSPIPSLAGQDARYIADALNAYKDGSRTHAIMTALSRGLDQTTINNLAGYYASLAPAQPADGAKTAAPGAEPVLVRNNLLASLDDRTADDIAGYFASLVPTRSGQPGAGAESGREPVVVRNGLVASLDERTARNVASYYASLAPRQPAGAREAPGALVPALVGYARPADGSSLGGIVSFRKNDPSRRIEQNNAICLGCHERGERTYWSGSTHETRGVACTECHTIMRPVSRKAALKTEVELDTCFQCHKDRRAQILRSSHMPLREGKITCSNCHNPHGSATEALLRENSVNDTCYKCHAEKRGPFLFEHAPVRENCLSCHDPHGSNNEYMLKVSRPRLCAECHGNGHGALVNGPVAVETFGRSCQNCHVAIHGSNSPSGALFQR
jgi:DmsE family decaheme c-type cytochrome